MNCQSFMKIMNNLWEYNFIIFNINIHNMKISIN